jgi:hypothetical protein
VDNFSLSLRERPAAIERLSLDVAKDYYLNELHGAGYEQKH